MLKRIVSINFDVLFQWMGALNFTMMLSVLELNEQLVWKCSNNIYTWLGRLHRGLPWFIPPFSEQNPIFNHYLLPLLKCQIVSILDLSLSLVIIYFHSWDVQSHVSTICVLQLGVALAKLFFLAEHEGLGLFLVACVPGGGAGHLLVSIIGADRSLSISINCANILLAIGKSTLFDLGNSFLRCCI